MNGGGRVQFASADLVDMVDNVSEQSVRKDRSKDVRTSTYVRRCCFVRSGVFHDN